MAKSAENAHPLVSVVIMTYNRPDYLRVAIASALEQTYRNIEVIVSDNRGSERTPEVVTSFDDPRLRYSPNERNLGVMTNVLRGVAASRGEYVAILNDDDRWGPDFLAWVVPFLEADPDLVVSFADHYIIDGDGALDDRATEEYTRRWRRNELLAGTYKPFCDIGLVHRSIPLVMAAVIRKAAIDWTDFPVNVGPAYDIWLTYLACRTDGGAHYLPERLTYYRVHAQAETTVGRIRTSAAHIYCFGRFLSDPMLAPFHAYFRRMLALEHYAFSIESLLIEQTTQARRRLRTSLSLRLNARVAAVLAISLLPASRVRQFLSWAQRRSS